MALFFWYFVLSNQKPKETGKHHGRILQLQYLRGTWKGYLLGKIVPEYEGTERND